MGDDDYEFDLDVGTIIDDYYSTFDNESSSSSLEVDKDITIGGLSVIERLKNIESILGLPERDIDLESKHPHLKELYIKHVESRKVADSIKNKYTEEMEKLRTFEILNDDTES